MEMAKFMYLDNNKSQPLPLHTLFTYNADIHEHNTRHHYDPHINIRRTKSLSLSFIHRAPALWYTTSSEIKNAKNVATIIIKSMTYILILVSRGVGLALDMISLCTGSWSHGDAAVWDTLHIIFFMLLFHMSHILLFTSLTYIYVYSLLLHTLNCVCIGLCSPFPFVSLTYPFISQYF